MNSDDELSSYRFPISPAPSHIEQLILRGVVAREFGDPIDEGQTLLGNTSPSEGVWRRNDGCVLVRCNTTLHNISPAMIDWWFGWHLPSSARYQLWHPEAHLKARVREDRSQLSDDKARYIDNCSYVDEYIGNKRCKLRIRFVQPSSLGLQLDSKSSTAVCAITGDRGLGGDGGKLVHAVVSKPTLDKEGHEVSEMRSAFWLGDIRHSFPIVNRIAGQWLNSRTVRKLIVPDKFALALLRHCSEEMHHLNTFLPQLYADHHNDS